jgi:hypothetical protein
MVLVPEEHVKSDSLKKIVRVGGAGGKSGLVGASNYNPYQKSATLECGRSSEKGGTTVGSKTELPDVSEDFQPVGAKTQSYFNWTTLHEIGHAVDDKEKFMERKGFQPEMGGWTQFGSNVSMIAQALQNDDRFKADGTAFNLDYITEKLKGNTPSAPDANGVDPGKWEAARKAIDEWVAAVGVDSKLWKDGAACKTRAIGGRVYHEAYKKDWVSYDLAARTRGISGYQFRAPGEWFAELYAAYYSGKLKPQHPFARIVEDELS